MRVVTPVQLSAPPRHFHWVEFAQVFVNGPFELQPVPDGRWRLVGQSTPDLPRWVFQYPGVNRGPKLQTVTVADADPLCTGSELSANDAVFVWSAHVLAAGPVKVS